MISIKIGEYKQNYIRIVLNSSEGDRLCKYINTHLKKLLNSQEYRTSPIRIYNLEQNTLHIPHDKQIVIKSRKYVYNNNKIG